MRASDDLLRGQIDDWFARRQDELLRDLSALINIKSMYGAPENGAPYGRGARDALDYTCGILKKLGFEAGLFEDCVAVCTIPGRDGGTRLDILVHVDVVDANPAEWASPPFAAEIRISNEYGEASPVLFGRGAVDDKGPAVASIYALACALELAGGLSGGARILIGSAEEIGCVDIARWLENNTPSEMAFSPDAGFPVVNTEKGRLTVEFCREFKRSDELPRVKAVHGGGTLNIIPGAASAVVEGITPPELERYAAEFSKKTGAEIRVAETLEGCKILVTGKAAHASATEGFCNAQTALLELLSALPLAESDCSNAIKSLAKLFPHGDTGGNALEIACRDELSGMTTLAFTVLDLNEHGFAAKLDSRCACVADTMDIEGTARTKITGAGFEVTKSGFTKSHHTPEESELVSTLTEIYREYTGDNVTLPYAIGGSTYVHEIAGGVAFGPELPGIDNRIHGRDEFVGVAQLMQAAKMYAMAILRLAG